MEREIAPRPLSIRPLSGGNDEPMIVFQGSSGGLHFQTWVFVAGRTQGGCFHLKRNLTAIVASGKGVCNYCIVDAEDDGSNPRMTSPIKKVSMNRQTGMALPAYTAYELVFDPASVVIFISDAPFDPKDEYRVDFFQARITTHD